MYCTKTNNFNHENVCVIYIFFLFHLTKKKIVSLLRKLSKLYLKFINRRIVKSSVILIKLQNLA